MSGKSVAKNPESRPSKGRPSSEQLWVALARCYRDMSIAVEQSLLASGLGLTDFMLLEALLHKGPLTITAIQASVLLATGSMTAAVDRLEKKGLIVRKFVKGDRRARLLELTGEGARVITVAYQQHSRDLQKWMDVLSAEERGEAFAALRKLERNLKDDLTAAQERRNILDEKGTTL